jgi:hypothetical protein
MSGIVLDVMGWACLVCAALAVVVIVLGCAYLIRGLWRALRGHDDTGTCTSCRETS